MSLNLILLIGNAGRDAELRYTASGRAVASFSMAVNRQLPSRTMNGKKRPNGSTFPFGANRLKMSPTAFGAAPKFSSRVDSRRVSTRTKQGQRELAWT